ncbi:hypothetical protein VitviT2T_011558 [Vitis vinifera]|uniref:Bulb-type lectin domain-containing protein n=1 Tax=Vitis vinifera TaxID=29760 RepID=A0ABY9CC45_VITVI|nr:hypothetical protein VitviT2T_011558 [Vitis vinifera]
MGYLFAILIFPPPRKDKYLEVQIPKVVWSANQNFLVRDDATLQLMQEGDLILRDADGNLVLFDSNNAFVWQSCDHPTDSLVLGQILVFGQKLTASASNKDWSQEAVSALILQLNKTEIGNETESDIESCKQACLRNCSCKAVVFWSSVENGETCYLLPEIFSLMKDAYLPDWTTFIKV